MINYDEITLEEIEFIKDADVICDGDKKEIILIERNNEYE